MLFSLSASSAASPYHAPRPPSLRLGPKPENNGCKALLQSLLLKSLPTPPLVHVPFVWVGYSSSSMCILFSLNQSSYCAVEIASRSTTRHHHCESLEEYKAKSKNDVRNQHSTLIYCSVFYCIYHSTCEQVTVGNLEHTYVRIHVWIRN